MEPLYGVTEKSDCDSIWKIFFHNCTRKKYSTGGDGLNEIEKELSTVRLEYDTDQIFFFLEKFGAILNALYKDPVYRKKNLDKELINEMLQVSYVYKQSAMNILWLHETALGRMKKFRKAKRKGEKKAAGATTQK